MPRFRPPPPALSPEEGRSPRASPTPPPSLGRSASQRCSTHQSQGQRGSSPFRYANKKPHYLYTETVWDSPRVVEMPQIQNKMEFVKVSLGEMPGAQALRTKPVQTLWMHRGGAHMQAARGHRRRTPASHPCGAPGMAPADPQDRHQASIQFCTWKHPERMARHHWKGIMATLALNVHPADLPWQMAVYEERTWLPPPVTYLSYLWLRDP